MRAGLAADLVVVGLGPAGASAALAAASGGLRVIGLDRRREAGLPVQCAEFVPGPLLGQASGLPEAIRQPISAMHTYLAGEAPCLTADFRGQMIDRAAFDQALVSAAVDAGAQVRFGASVKAITPEGVVLQNGEILDAPVLIGADGPRSLLGLAIGAGAQALVETRQITVPLHEPHAATDIFLSPDYRGGYAWLFPKGAVAHIGLGVEPALRHQLKGLLEALHAALVATGRVGREIMNLTGGAIPVGGLRRCTGMAQGRSILLAGDAAGLTNPVTGAGIASAVQSGRMAGEATVRLAQGHTQAVSDYALDLDDIFGVSLARAVARRTHLMAKPTADVRAQPQHLRQGWIAYPEYWAPLTIDGTRQNFSHNERALP
ncbi:MAG: NAD(P)/FAD-dependent oxidoreductase [Hyphomicrobiales bacterium]|nr:NAD(P)/FAD-dependent oxidoreductase [Hyphomicrobiales bacterium]